MFELHQVWCENHGFPYKIINDHFYWQTFIQTGEDYIDENGKWHTRWHPWEYFNKI